MSGCIPESLAHQSMLWKDITLAGWANLELRELLGNLISVYHVLLQRELKGRHNDGRSHWCFNVHFNLRTQIHWHSKELAKDFRPLVRVALKKQGLTGHFWDHEPGLVQLPCLDVVQKHHRQVTRVQFVFVKMVQLCFAKLFPDLGHNPWCRCKDGVAKRRWTHLWIFMQGSQHQPWALLMIVIS